MSKAVKIEEEQQTPLTSAEVERITSEHIAQIRSELATLTASRDAAEHAVRQAEAAVEQAQTHASNMGRAVASVIGQLAAAKARVLITQGRPEAAAANETLAALQAEQEHLQGEQAAATHDFHQRVATLAERRAALTAAQTTLASAQVEMEQLVAALEKERATAHHEAGLQKLTQTRHAFGEAEQQLAAAQAQVAAAQARIAEIREQAAHLAAEHPTLADAIAPMLPVRETAATRILMAHRRWLEALAIDAGSGIPPIVGRQAIPAVIGEWSATQYQHIFESREGAARLADRVRLIDQMLADARRGARG